MTATVISFDTLAFVKELEGAGVPPVQAEAQARALSSVIQQVEESRREELKELSTKGDILRLEKRMEKEIELVKAELRKEIETAKVETIKWVIATGFIILGGVAAINRLVPPPTPVYYHAPAQEVRQPAPSVQPSAPLVQPIQPPGK
ncbi:MAG: hypothetical protein HQL64_03990 [Magnetococcales bacterium]|nr:hypothetical protein [Magnetococcales bacterium]